MVEGETYEKASALVASLKQPEAALNLLPYTAEWFNEYDRLTSLSNTLLDDRFFLDGHEELLNRMEAINHPVHNFLQFQATGRIKNNSPKELFNNTLYPAASLSMPVLSWFYQQVYQPESIAFLEHIRSFYFAICDRTGCPSYMGNYFERQGNMYLQSLLREMYQTDDILTWIKFLPERYSGEALKTGETLAVLTAFNQYISGIESDHGRLVTTSLADLLDLYDHLEAHAQGVNANLHRFLALVLTEGSANSIAQKEAYLSENSVLIKAAQLAAAQKDERPELALTLVQTMEEKNISEQDMGNSLAWAPFIYSHYDLVYEILKILESRQHLPAVMSLFRSTMNWSCKQSLANYEAFLSEMVDFSLKNFKQLDTSFIREVIDRYCGQLTQKSYGGAKLLRLKSRILTTSLVEGYQHYLSRIDEYLAYRNRAQRSH